MTASTDAVLNGASLACPATRSLYITGDAIRSASVRTPGSHQKVRTARRRLEKTKGTLSKSAIVSVFGSGTAKTRYSVPP